MSHFNRTKIVATMGPATADINVLEGMFKEGLERPLRNGTIPGLCVLSPVFCRGKG